MNALLTVSGVTNLLGLPRGQLEQFFAEIGEKSFRAEQTLKWVHQYGVADFQDMTNLSHALRARLPQFAEIRAPMLEREQTAADGTRKWLLQVENGNGIEMVFIPEDSRGTLCVSSQVGCALNCSFCSTAQQGFNRNLTAAEIVGQLWLADRLLAGSAPKSNQPPNRTEYQGPRSDGLRAASIAGPGTDPRSDPGSGQEPARRSNAITNVVLMGMGEPLLNFEQVTQAIDLMLEDCAYGLARRRITLSTAGVVPGIDRLADRAPVSLAVSLHATTDQLRNELVPINRKYPIAMLLDACRRYARVNPKHQITFEYVMLDGVNDSVPDARRLLRLLADVPAKVNLIPFNPFPQAPYLRSKSGAIARFREVLNEGGLVTITRRPRGDDIDAACGQLAGRVTARGRRSARHSVAVAAP